MKKIFLLTFLLLYLQKTNVSSLNTTKLANYTVVGKSTSIEKYPSLVYLGRCVGVLVALQYILTAGHCIHEEITFKAYIGHSDKYHGKEFSIVEAFRPPNFTRNKTLPNYDIALLKIDSPVTQSKKIRIAEIAKSTDVFTPGTYCVIAGWGSLSRVTFTRTNHLHNGLMVIAKPSKCTFPRFSFDKKSELCVKSIRGINQAAAPGDSGAPLFCRRPCDNKLVVAGVDSRGILPDQNESLDIFTKVSYHSIWIKYLMNS